MLVLCDAHLDSTSIVCTRDGRPAPPRGKTGCPAPQKEGLAPPRPAKLTKSAGRSEAKLTGDSIDTLFHYALMEERVGKSSNFLCLQIVTIFFTEIPLKSERR